MKKILSILLLFGATIPAIAEVIHGQVKDAAGEPLIGVSVMVPGTQNGTVTDFDGNYVLDAGSAESLEFSYIGFHSSTEKIGNRSEINIVLREDNQLLDEVVVVGYGTQRKANLTGAVASVSVQEQFDSRPITNIGNGLQGATPGLTITNTSGQIGGTPKFRIRGAVGTLLNEGGSQPLILVDGVEISDISMINPDDIKEISVLKDAASSSIYGTRAAFGVLLITTKDGADADKKFTISYSNNFSWGAPTVKPQVAKTYECAGMALEAAQRHNPGTSVFNNSIQLQWTAEDVERMREWDEMFSPAIGVMDDEMVLGRDFIIRDGKPVFYRSWDPEDMYTKDWAFSQQHNISVSGNTGKTNFHLGLGYMGEGGVIKVNPDDFKRYSVDFGTETQVNKYVKVRTKAMYTRTDLETPFSMSGSTYGALYYLYRWPSMNPYGTYQGIPFRNAITDTKNASMNSTIKDYARFSIGTTIMLGIPDLTLDIDYTFNLDNKRVTQRGGTSGGWDYWGGSLVQNDNWVSASYNKIDKYFYDNQYHAGNAVLRYNHTWNDAHHFSAFVGYNIEYKELEMTNPWRLDLLDETKHEFNLATGDIKIESTHSSWGIMGVFARINYNYKNRYLIELNGRADGSSRFPIDQQWGFFPSGSVGWVGSEEDFWEVLKPYWSFFKLRASYGSVGNQDIGNNMFRALMATGNSSWVIDDVNQNTLGLPTALRNGFTWETIRTIDAGTDMRFFNDDLGLTFDWYRRINDNMVVGGAEVPSTFGAAAPYENAAQLTTNGWELGLDYHHKFANGLRLNASFNLADARTFITKHPRKGTSVLDGSNYEGKEYGEIWGFVTDRLFQEDDFNEDGTLKEGIATQTYFEQQATSATGRKCVYGPGDVKYVDLNGDGEISWGNKTAEDHGDWTVIGNTTPRYEYNFSLGGEWHGVDLRIFFQGVGKRDYWATGNMMIPNWFFNEGTFYAHQLDYWTPENIDAYYPRLSQMAQPSQYGASGFNFLCQSRYLLDMSYLRLKNITLGYNLPKKALKKMHFEKFRIYFSAENICEITHLNDRPIDPETQTSSGDGGAMGFGRSYPFTRKMSCGLQISL